MDNATINNIVYKQELDRANAIIEVAERDGKDVATTLREYGVATSIVDQLGYEAAPVARKAKRTSMQDRLEQWAKDHIGQTTNGGKQISEDLGISYPTANNFVQSRRDIFSKIKKGVYMIKDAEAERLAAKN